MESEMHNNLLMIAAEITCVRWATVECEAGLHRLLQ